MPPDPGSDGPRNRRGSARRAASDDAQRARIVVVCLAVLVALIAGTALIAAFVDDGSPAEPSAQVEGAEGQEAGAPPEIVPQPNSGKAPDEAGDRGGWAQLTLLGLIVAAVVGIGFVVMRGSRRSRANRAAWLAATESGRDGALDDHRT